jgi:hypothetical protein
MEYMLMHIQNTYTHTNIILIDLQTRAISIWSTYGSFFMLENESICTYISDILRIPKSTLIDVARKLFAKG